MSLIALPTEVTEIFIESLKDYSQFLQNYNKEGNTEIEKEYTKSNSLIDYLNENKESNFIELHSESVAFIKSTLTIFLEKLIDEKNKKNLEGESKEAIEGLNKKISNIKKILDKYKCFKDIPPKNLITKINKKYKEYKKEQPEEIFKLEPEIYGIGIKLKPLLKQVKRFFKKKIK